MSHQLRSYTHSPGLFQNSEPLDFGCIGGTGTPSDRSDGNSTDKRQIVFAPIFVFIDLPFSRDVLAEDEHPRPNLNALAMPEASVCLNDLEVGWRFGRHIVDRGHEQSSYSEAMRAKIG